VVTSTASYHIVWQYKVWADNQFLSEEIKEGGDGRGVKHTINVVALRVGLVSSRCFHHPPRTVASPTTHSSSPSLTFAHPRLRHCSLLLSGCSILVTLGASCQLECVNFRRRNPSRMEGCQSWLPGVQNWMQSLRHALPPVFSYKAWPAALVLSISSSLPVYRALVVVPIIWQYVFFAARKSSL